MDNDVEHKIRKRAYDLWVQDGQVPGRSDDYWLQAEREILGTANEGSLGVSDATGGAEPISETSLKPTRKTAAGAAVPKTAKPAGATRAKRNS
jgi:hypothetical protein